jgi:endothelin-converting enzyme/putative endopeptidase
MGQDIQQVDWMAPETKQKGQEKLHAVMDKVGYPDQWRDYSSVTSRSRWLGGQCAVGGSL